MKKRVKSPVVIVGGGPTGLGAAYLLHRTGFDDWLLYERDAVVGGLSRSFLDDHGFTWDVGGHVVFSHYGFFTRLLDDLLGPSGWIDHQRESWIHVADTWVPYPFQNNIHRLPRELCALCLEGLLKAALNGSERACSNFDEFLVRTFGEGMADIFLRPYNSKVWAYPPAKLDLGWVGERIAVPDPLRVVRNVVMQTDDVSWGPNNYFRFPARGGTGAIWNALASHLPPGRIQTGQEVVALDSHAKVLHFANGSKQPYGTLISSMPLDQLATISGRKDWIELASGLKHSAVNVIGVGLRGKPSATLSSKCWMYFPHDSIAFYRLTHFSHYSPDNVDDIHKHWSLMAEVSESPEKPIDHATLADATIRSLLAVGLIEGPDQVTHTWTHRVEYGYPTPALGRDAILRRLLPQLHKRDILSRGRFGAWLYEVGNMDHAFMQGLEAASHVLHGYPEMTVWHPHLVNQPHPVLGWDRFR
jgi:protoporphyrinogen oxidase